MPLATILITSFEQRPFLMDAIMSATNQTVENLEIILVTKFDAKSILSQSLTKDLRYFEVKDAKTKGALIKYGLKRARTDIIMFLDDDDVFYPDKAEYIISIFKKNNNIGLIHNNFTRIGESFNFNDSIQYKNDNLKNEFVCALNLREAFKKGCDRNLSSMSIRLSALNEYIERLDSIETSDDSFIFYSVYESGFAVCYTTRQLTFYRIHTGGKTNLTGTFNVYIEKGKWKLTSDVSMHKLFLDMFNNYEIKEIQKLRLSYYRSLLYQYTDHPILLNEFLRDMINHLKFLRNYGGNNHMLLNFYLWTTMLISRRLFLISYYLISLYRLKKYR